MAIMEQRHAWKADGKGSYLCSRCGESSPKMDNSSCVVDVPQEPHNIAHNWSRDLTEPSVLCLRCGAKGVVVTRSPLQITTETSIWCGGKTAEEEWVAEIEGVAKIQQRAKDILAGGPPQPHDWAVGTPSLEYATCRNCGVVTRNERDARGAPGPAYKEPCFGRGPVGPTHDAVNHPSHYTSSPARCSKCDHPIECIDVVEHMTFSLGNCVKYLWRMGLKEGEDPITTLRKGAWYIAREIKRLEAAACKK